MQYCKVRLSFPSVVGRVGFVDPSGKKPNDVNDVSYDAQIYSMQDISVKLSMYCTHRYILPDKTVKVNNQVIWSILTRVLR